MKALMSSTFCAVSCLCASLACSAADPAENAELGADTGADPRTGTAFESQLADVQPDLVDVEVLHEFQAGTDSLKFLRAGGNGESATLMIEFARSGFYPKGTLDLLIARDPELTLLETFYALAPEGMTPHSALVEAHDAQAERRGDPALRTVDFDAGQLVEKSIASCNADLQFQIDSNDANVPAGNVAALNNRTGATAALCPGTNFAPDCFTMTVFYVTATSCLDSTGLQSIRPWWKRNNGNWQTFNVFASQLGPNSITGWHLPAFEPPPPGQLFSPSHILAIEAGSGGLYHLRAARATL